MPVGNTVKTTRFYFFSKTKKIFFRVVGKEIVLVEEEMRPLQHLPPKKKIYPCIVYNQCIVI